MENRQQVPVRLAFLQSIRRRTHWQCLLLTILLYITLLMLLCCTLRTPSDLLTPSESTKNTKWTCTVDYLYIPIVCCVILYLAYAVECWHSHAMFIPKDVQSTNVVYEYLQGLQLAPPVIWWKAVCYHYLRRTRQVTRYRNGDAFTTTQVYYKRFNSHTAYSSFHFGNAAVKDISKHLTSLEDHPIIHLEITKGFSFATVNAENEFESQRAEFFQEHEYRDDYMETQEGLDLIDVSFKKKVIVYADSSPWYISSVSFWILSMFLLSWPLRIMIQYNTGYVRYHIHKLFGCNECTGYPCLNRVCTMDSLAIERTIRSNNSILPTYSEALLMNSDSMTLQRLPSYTFSSDYSDGGVSGSRDDVGTRSQTSEITHQHRFIKRSLKDYLRSMRSKAHNIMSQSQSQLGYCVRLSQSPVVKSISHPSNLPSNLISNLASRPRQHSSQYSIFSV